jgi:hypothetical protein
MLYVVELCVAYPVTSLFFPLFSALCQRFLFGHLFTTHHNIAAATQKIPT